MSKYVKIGIYAIFGLSFFLSSREAFGDLFAAGTGIWSFVMLTASGLCLLLASVIAISWAFLSSGTLRAKYFPYKLVNNYTVPVLIVLLFIASDMARSSSDGDRATKLGFKDGTEFANARKNNITNIADYKKFVEEQRIKEAEEKAKNAVRIAEEKRIAEENEAKCFDDVDCYVSKHESGDYQCKVAVEESSKYQFKWTDGFSQQKFTASSWYDKSRRLVTLYGHRAQAQNGFGAFKNVQYSCVFNADTGEVLMTNIQ